MTNEISASITCYPQRLVRCDFCETMVAVDANVFELASKARTGGFAVQCSRCRQERKTNR